jgi:phospholipid-binding lipoprotein MlaA
VRQPFLLVLACLVTLAPLQASATPGDPYERLNRKSFALSLKLDRYIVGPLARLSRGLTPGPVNKMIHNIIVNLSEPQVIINDLFQVRPQKAIEALTRLIVNTTFGLGGSLDLAAGAGLHYHPNGFGDTLGHYGVKTGPYLFIPVLGPSDFRDVAGAGVDQVSSPIFWIDYPYRTAINLGLAAAGGLGQRQDAQAQLNALLTTAADPYATLRSTYLQAREAQIRGQGALPPLPDIEGPDAAAPSTNPAEPAAPTPPDQAAAAPSPDASAPAPTPAPDQAAPVSPSPAPPPSDQPEPPAGAPNDAPSPASPPSLASP